ncbi:MAG: thioredoxin family protein [Myxococcales bacterium]|nr:thioredoxin family protein [Myxococcales bacterium]
MDRAILVIPLLVIAAGCKKDGDAPGPAKEPAKVSATVSAACGTAKQEGPIAWIEDDYASALACAKEKNLPLVLDLWAPWCHTCLSMKSTVFMDGSFELDADKFVFAALDTDREDSAPVVAKFPLSAWPTFYVIDHDETVLARWVGSASTPQFHAFLDAGIAARAGAEGAGKRLLEAERALAAKNYGAAEKALMLALAEAPADWVRRPDALVSLLSTISRQHDDPRCVEVAIENMEKTGSSASAADFASLALSCAGSPKVDATRVGVLRALAIKRLEGLLAQADAHLSVDDRSDAMVILREVYEAIGKQDEAKALAEKQRALIDDAAQKATSPLAAMTFNWQRAEVYVYLGRPLDIVPALEKSAADLPGEYDPRARLGWVYLKAKKLPEAAKWTDEALKLVYGPRKGRVIAQRAEIAKEMGDVAGERRFRTEAVALWESLPPAQQSADALAKAKDALAKLDAAPTPAPSTN